jgi:hypothetical protein
MQKDFILAEIRRTAADNGGVALGRERFEKATGIAQNDWYGVYWSKWSDAVREAGCTPDVYQRPYALEEITKALALFTRELGRFPVSGELRLKARSDPNFPSHGVFNRLGAKQDRIARVLDYCARHPGLEDVAAICQPLVAADSNSKASARETDVRIGFVYLARMGKHYKIGHTWSVGRREYDLAIQMPERLTLVHSIRTDDPPGIEAYWHKRFIGKNTNGEWFALTAEEVKAFKRRRTM